MDVRQPYEFKNRNFIFVIIAIIAVLILLGTIFLYTKLKETSASQLQGHLQDASIITVNPVADVVEGNIKALTRIAKHWPGPDANAQALWYADFQDYFTTSNIYEAILYADNALHIKWVVPAKYTQQLQNANLNLTLPEQNQLLQLAKESNGPVISKMVHFLIASKVFFIIIPVSPQQIFQGYIVGVINVEKLFPHIFRHGLGSSYNLAIYQGTERVYASDDSSLYSSFALQERTLKLHNIEWKFYIWPTDQFMNTYDNSMPEVILLGGSIISVLMLIISYLYYRSVTHENRALKAQSQAEKVAERLEKIIDTVNEGFLSFDENGKIIGFNPYAEKMLGWKKSEARGEDIYSLLIPERHREEYKDLITTVKVTGNTSAIAQEMEFKAIKRGGREFPVQVILFPLVLENGDYTFNAFFRDITARVKAEADQARYVSIVNESEDAILSTDLDGIITTWNQGAERLFKYTANEAIGQSVSMIYPREQWSEIKENIDDIKKGEHVRIPDTPRLAKDGQMVAVSSLAMPMQDRSGKIIGISFILHDIKEIKEIEKIKGEFISIVCDELLTPLMIVHASIVLLATEKFCKLSPKAKEVLDNANDHCHKVIHLINEILDIEKIEAGKIAFTFHPFDLRALIEEVVSANRLLAEKNNVTIHLEAVEKIQIKGDPARLAQVITNLLSNAIRFSPPNSTIEIVMKKMNDNVRVSVSDHGSGVPQMIRDKIFGKFSHADDADAKMRSGTGLGLNLSKIIIEKHRGFISFTTIEGIGTTFFFDLPLATSPVMVKDLVK